VACLRHIGGAVPFCDDRGVYRKMTGAVFAHRL
jgi:hypothetical protein